MHRGTFRDPFERTSPPLHTVSRNASPALLVVAVIPARYHSTRLPGKALADIAGRPMIEHVYRRAAAAPGVDAVVVATDDERIAEAVARFGGVARMTSAAHASGTDRVAEVAAALDCAIVVNVQGDEPLIEPRMIAQAVGALDGDPAVMMSTLRRRITEPDDLRNPNVVKVVVDAHDDALLFARLMPFRHTDGPFYKHVGLYVYRREFLLQLAALPRTPLEVSESLEQLRVLEHGYRIRAVETDYDSIGVDTPDDLERVRRQMAVGTSA